MPRAVRRATSTCVPGRHHATHQTHRQGVLRGDAIVGRQDDALGLLRARHPGQQHRHDAGAELQLRLAEDRILRSDRDVACHRQLECTGQAGTVNRRDRRLRAVPEAHRRIEVEIEDLAPDGRAFRPLLHLRLQVEPRGEGPTRAAHDDDAHLRVGLQRIDRAVDFQQRRLVQRVQPLGPAERQVRHLVGDSDGEVLVGGHAVDPCVMRRVARAWPTPRGP